MIVVVYGKPVENLDGESKVKAQRLWREVVKFVRANVKRYGEEDSGEKPEGMDPTVFWTKRFSIVKYIQ